MNIQLTPHGEELVQAELARGKFQSVEEVVEHALVSLSEKHQSRRHLEAAAFEAMLDALAEGSDKLPILPPEATNRSEIYRDL